MKKAVNIGGGQVGTKVDLSITKDRNLSKQLNLKTTNEKRGLKTKNIFY
jgi:hypothetical protein